MNLNDKDKRNDGALSQDMTGATTNDLPFQRALYGNAALLHRGNTPSVAAAVAHQQRLDDSMAMPAAHSRASQNSIEMALSDRERTSQIEKLRPRVRQHVMNVSDFHDLSGNTEGSEANPRP